MQEVSLAKAYQVSGGLHGVGANASMRFRNGLIEVKRDSKVHKMESPEASPLQNEDYW